MNKVILMGRLCQDPEKRSNECIRFSLAVPRYKSKDGNEVTDFINIVAFKNTAKFINKFFHKGDKIIIAGSLNIDKFDGKTFTSVVVDNFNGVYFPESLKNKKESRDEKEVEPW